MDRNQQLKVLNRTLQESSLSDPLTGLRNRRFVFEEVSRDLDVVRRRLTDEHQGIDTSGLVTAPGETFRWGGVYSDDGNTRETLFTHLNVFADFDPELIQP